MPGRGNSRKQQFAAVEELLTHWLRERRQLLGTYTEIVVSLNGAIDTAVLAEDPGRRDEKRSSASNGTPASAPVRPEGWSNRTPQYPPQETLRRNRPPSRGARIRV